MRQRENILLNHVLGQDNNTNPELLKEGYVQDITNLVIDSVGDQYKLKQRNGMSIFNNNTFGTTATKCLYDLLSANETNYMVAGSGTVLAKSLAGTGAWVNIKTGLTNPKVNVIPYNKNFYCTNGAEAPFVFGGDALASLWNLGIERPTGITSITHTHQVAGGLTQNSRYKYLLVYVTEDGERSLPSRPFMIRDTAMNQKVTFFSLPTPTDTRVTQKILYRTKASQDDYYRLYPKNATTGTVVTMLSASEGSFIDDIADADLDLADTIDFTSIPNYAKAMAVHKERLFLGNIARTEKALIEPAYDPDRTLASYESVEGALVQDVEYTVRICYMDSTGAYSDYEDFTIYIEAPYNAIQVNSLPVMSTKFAQGIEKILIFRSQSGSATLKLSETIDPDKETFKILTKADAELGITFPTYATIKQSSSVVYSELGKLNELPLINNIMVNPDDGDEITAIFDDENGILIFKKYSIWKIYTNGSPENWQAEKLFTDLGTEHWSHVCKNGREYVVYYQRQIYLIQGTEYVIISDPVKKNITEEGKTFNSITYDPKNNWYIFPITEEVVPPGTTKIMIYHRELKCWYKFISGVWGSSEFANTVAIKRYGTYANSIIISDGKLKRYDSAVGTDASSSSTVAISSSFKTRVYPLGDGFNKSIIRELTISGEGTLGVEIYSGASNISGSLTLTKDVPYSLNLLAQKISIVIGCTAFDSLKLSFRKVLRGKQQ